MQHGSKIFFNCKCLANRKSALNDTYILSGLKHPAISHCSINNMFHLSHWLQTLLSFLCFDQSVHWRIEHYDAVSSPLHYIEGSCVSNQIMNSGAVEHVSVDVSAYWRMRHTLLCESSDISLGSGREGPCSPSNPSSGWAKTRPWVLIQTRLCLSACVCVWQIHCPLITHLTSCHMVRICQPAAQGLESVCPVCQCWHDTSWFDTDKARNLQK